MPLRWKYLVFGSAALVSTAALFYELQNQSKLLEPIDSLSLNGGSNGNSGEKTQTQSPIDGLRFQPMEGYLYTYRFERAIEIQSELKNSIPPINYDGEFDLGVSRVKENGFEAFVTERLSSKTIQSLRGATIPEPIVMKLSVDTDAQTVSLLSPKSDNEGDKQHAAVLKDLIACWLFPLHSDTTGNYEAEFSTLSPEKVQGVTFLRFLKKKTAYLKSKSPTPEILSSSHIMSWDSKLKLPNQITGTERSEFKGDRLSLLTESSYSIQFLSLKKGLGSLALSLSQNLQIDTLSLAATGSNVKPLKPSVNWASLNDRLAHFHDFSAHDQLDIFGDLTSLLRAEPKTVSDLMGFLQSQDVIKLGAQSPLFKTIVGALITSGSPDAQAAAIQIYQDTNCPVSGKGTILSSFTTTQAPIESATRSFLTSVMLNDQNSDLAAGAGFALGASLSPTATSTTSTPSVQQAVQTIQNSWKETVTSANVSQELALLDVMGNSGNVSFLPNIESAISDSSDPSLRSKAVFALRFMNNDQASQTLTTSLSDSNSSVRLAAASAMGLANWNPTFEAPLRNCIKLDTSSQVRTACQKVLDQSAE